MKITKYRLAAGLCPDPLGGAKVLHCSPDLLAAIRGLLLREGEGKGEEGRKGMERGGGEGMEEGEGKRGEGEGGEEEMGEGKGSGEGKGAGAGASQMTCLHDAPSGIGGFEGSGGVRASSSSGDV